MNKIYQKNFPGHKNAGFTLIELLVVVLIIGILATAAMPQYEKAAAKSRYTKLILAGKSLKDAMESYYLANGDYPQMWDQLDLEYTGCEYSGNARYMLWCDNFAVDMFNALDANLVIFDVHGLEDNGKNMPSTTLLEQAESRYVVWLDRSDHPGKTECRSKISGLCKNMGY